MWLTGAAGSIAAVAQIPGIVVPEWVPEIAGYIAVVGATITVISRLPVQGSST